MGLAIASLSVLLIALTLFELLSHERCEQNQISEVTRELSEVRAKLEYSINSNLNLARGLSTFISLNPNLSQQEFERFTEPLLSIDHQIQNFGAAKNLVVSHV
jgi:sensor domain CHASE-containing protein